MMVGHRADNPGPVHLADATIRLPESEATVTVSEKIVPIHTP